MTHFNPAIEELLRSNPKSQADRKARRRALAILYSAERREDSKRRHKSKSKRKQQSSSGSFASFLFHTGKDAVESRVRQRVERKRAIKYAEARITSEKRIAGYHTIDPKITHKQAVSEVDKGFVFVPETRSARESRLELEARQQRHDTERKALERQIPSQSTTITGKPKNVIIRTETTDA